MLDRAASTAIAPLLQVLARRLVRAGVGADGITLAGFAIGLAGSAAIALQHPLWGLALLAASRLCDGLDGAVARAQGKSDFGGHLDIACDFTFYGAVPLAFVLADPATNGAAGAFLLFSFYVNAASFLGFAILAEKRGMETRQRGEKSLYFTAGLMEGTETILCLVLVVLWPVLFGPVAWVFGALCLLTAAARMVLSARTFR
jgi:phosphatidylglycerophosphate synthase